MRRLKTCAVHGCPNLAPCETHSRPANASWSRDRDRQAQHRFRQAVLQRDGHRCRRCRNTGHLVAHHLRPGYDPADGVTLCQGCHRAIDANAR
jgi:hypothetical protein